MAHGVLKTKVPQSLIRKSSLRKLAGDGFRLSADFYTAFEVFVEEKLYQCRSRARSNGRVTVMDYDL